MAEGISMALIYTFMGLMILTGSINTISSKLQLSMKSLGIEYKHHQWFVTFCMFVGEVTCLIGYCIVSCRKKEENESEVQSLIAQESSASTTSENLDLKINVNQDLHGSTAPEPPKKAAKLWYFLLPAMCDLCGTTLMTFGLTYLAGSVFQMFRGMLIFFTALFSFMCLHSKIFSHHILGICLVICGLVLVGLNSVLSSDSESSNAILGIVLVVSGQVFSATCYITEEKLLKSYSAHPLQLVGSEGFWGVIVYIIMLASFQFIRCESWDDWKSKICMENDSGEFRLEDTVFAFRQMGNNLLLLFYVLLYIFSIALFNFVGISVTKYVSSTARAVVDSIRTLVVWVFFLTMPFVPASTMETFSWLQLGGFVILLLGTLIYNEIVEIPICGLNKNTKSEIARSAKNKKEKFIAC